MTKEMKDIVMQQLKSQGLLNQLNSYSHASERLTLACRDVMEKLTAAKKVKCITVKR
jgi:hypothetical protein